jgi:hypothetical protein
MTRTPHLDGIRWHPVSVIEKYSPDQTAFARRYFEGHLTGDVLRGLFIGRGPECGTVRDQGNGVSAAGSGNFALLLAGLGGHPLAEGRTVFGVGGDDTAFSREHVHLSPVAGEEVGGTWYKPMDPGYPAVTRTGDIEGQATFLEHEACFTWREWCWGTGPGRPVPHHSLRGCYGGEQPVMMNRKAHPAGYGTKDPGVAWVFRAEVTLS